MFFLVVQPAFDIHPANLRHQVHVRRFRAFIFQTGEQLLNKFIFYRYAYEVILHVLTQITSLTNPGIFEANQVTNGFCPEIMTTFVTFPK